ncbi:1,4-alpha-glucan branching protein GlgB [Chryseolinea lacunae]|uniref:1,4-alpha-glucan branching enzyme GlgB n=1 Tax=Chryseolinea lacunae TaxID=2801331 RepID=A0ABS1KWM2_9BACT|nr:1,4-alpha-glucan branching protein GlgB [Chryseolinea lacunae]MBL0743657.1 1,4-alpha-glucan branching protein GlgB [Chryseolinea lacunae]
MSKKTKTPDPIPASFSLLTEFDVHLFKTGKHYKLYDKLGAHRVSHEGQEGTYFAVWAPNAVAISVIGNFNAWKDGQHKLFARWDESGIWEGFFSDISHGEAYKYAIHSNSGEYLEKADPFATFAEMPPMTASIVWAPKFEWKDETWLNERKASAGKPKPYSVYEVHYGSWRRKIEEGDRSLTYPEMAIELVNYVKDMQFTHVEFLPLMEHPFYGSWGYQLTGYFAPTSRYGSPEDFMYLIDSFHRADIGVLLDWVPSHFPGDAHGLFNFDGTHLYEHADPRKGFHPDWKSYIFNYGRSEVRSFLISNAVYWLDKFHIDGLRVDAVASMLYLDYSRKAGEWIPNDHGGNENIEAITFLKEMNEVVYAAFPDAVTIAEESTSWTGVSRPTYIGGLGFGQKWMMGWMHDTLQYFKHEPIHRKYHQNEITFSIMYAFTENFMLPLSHDEVVHGKGSLIGRMPGDEWQRFANLRLMFTYMFAHPGTKLLFMGGEFAQSSEWNHEKSLDWHLLAYDVHKGIQQLVRDLNQFYRNEPALYQHQFEQKGFSWVDYDDRENSVMVFQRQGEGKENVLIIVCNFTPETRRHYRVGVPYRGNWKEVFNSDQKKYAGSGVLNEGTLLTSPVKYHGRDYSISLTLPPLGISILRLEKEISEFDLNDLGT